VTVESSPLAARIAALRVRMAAAAAALKFDEERKG